MTDPSPVSGTGGSNGRVTGGSCVACRRPLDADADLCPECASYQDWSRHVVRWSGLGSALLAILPLWGIAYSGYRYVNPRSAEIEAAVLACEVDGLKLGLLNTGGRPTALGALQFEVARSPTSPARADQDRRELSAQPMQAIKPEEFVIVGVHGRIAGSRSPDPFPVQGESV